MKKVRPIVNKIKDQKLRQRILKYVDEFSQDPPPLAELEKQLDKVWLKYKCDATQPISKKIDRFYSDPIWTLNGLMMETDEHAMENRHIISKYIARKTRQGTVIDFGGGFGTLAQLITQKNKKLQVDIYEPYPPQLAKNRINKNSRVTFTKKIKKDFYDLGVVMDVFEHVPDPLLEMQKLIDSVKVGGTIIIANCFYPLIKCHLPQSFHFRYSIDIFSLFPRMMGLERVGYCDTVEYAVVYKKRTSHSPNWPLIRFVEKLSQISFPLLEFAYWCYQKSGLLKLRLFLRKFMQS